MSVHYHVWFHFKTEVGDSTGLEIAERFLAEMRAQGVRCELAQNRGSAPKSKLDRYHALFEFEDDDQMTAVFGAKREEGIEQGPHGELMRAVANFHVEVFASIAPPEKER